MDTNNRITLEEMRTQIEEWFAQEYELAAVSKLYAELRIELEEQMRFMMENILGERIREERGGRRIGNA